MHCCHSCAFTCEECSLVPLDAHEKADMLCIYSLANVVREVALSFVDGDEPEPAEDGTADSSCYRHNPSSVSLSSDHWSWRLTCGVCLEFFRTPVILSCGHTFCRRCMVAVVDHERRDRAYISEDSVRIRCPECRHVIRINGVRNRFVHNRTAATVLEAWLHDRNKKQLVDRGNQTTSTGLAMSTQTSIPAESSGLQPSCWRPSPNRAKNFDQGEYIRRRMEEDRQRLRAMGKTELVAERVLTSDGSFKLAIRARPIGYRLRSPDRWGIYTQCQPLPSHDQTFWISPVSDISKYGWYFNHLLFAFFLAMLFKDTKPR